MIPPPGSATTGRTSRCAHHRPPACGTILKVFLRPALDEEWADDLRAGLPTGSTERSAPCADLRRDAREFYDSGVRARRGGTWRFGSHPEAHGARPDGPAADDALRAEERALHRLLDRLEEAARRPRRARLVLPRTRSPRLRSPSSAGPYASSSRSERQSAAQGPDQGQAGAVAAELAAPAHGKRVAKLIESARRFRT